MTAKKQDPTERLDAAEHDAPKHPAPQSCVAVVIHYGRTWAKGRSLEHAIANANRHGYKATHALEIFAVYCPAGCYVHPDSLDGYSDVWVDKRGHLRAPSKAAIVQITEQALQLRTVSDSKHAEG